MLWVGDKGRDIYNTWKLTDEEKKKLATYYTKFKEYVEPKSNVVFARYKFNRRIQDPTESIEQFVTGLKLLAKPCRFKDEDEMIRDRVVIGCQSDKAREDLIKEGSELSLTKAIDIARTQELSTAQLKSMSGAEAVCNVIKAKDMSKQRYKGNPQQEGKPHKVKYGQNTASNTNTFQRCGTLHAYGK